MPTAICFIEKMRKQRPVAPGSAEYQSGNWDVAEAKAAALVGSLIYFHETQSGPSYYGGRITGYRVLPPDHPETPGRIVFTFTPELACRGFLAGRSGWRNEQKTIP
jgi:hypothetical protein